MKTIFHNHCCCNVGKQLVVLVDCENVQNTRWRQRKTIKSAAGMFPHTLCIIKGLLNQAINTHTHSPCLLGFISMVTCVFPSDAAGDCDGCEIWRREQSRIRTSHYFLCVPPGAPERTWGEIGIIDPRIDSDWNDYSPSHQCRCDDGEVLVFSDTICLLPHPDASVHRLVCVDAPLPKHSGILPIIPLLLTH